jgi:type VI secretion system protein ImpG
MFNKYYQDELAFLREMGEEFAAAHPQVAHMLAAHGTDPDVERLLEGFAFLTGRIRQKLDDELPEITHTLMGLLWPHYLRPIPAMSVVEFRPRPAALRDRQVVARGVEIHSVPVDGTPCRFRTAAAVEMWPIELTDARIEEPAGESPRLVLALRPLEGVSLAALDVQHLRFLLHGEPRQMYGLYLLFTRLATGLTIEARVAGKVTARRDRPAQAVRPCGFSDEETLLPYPPNAFPGYRLVQEYFALAAKFLAVDLTDLATSELGEAEEWVVRLRYRRPAGEMPRVSADNLRLFCTPVVNLFPHRSDPLRVEHDRTAYRIRPEGKDPAHYEIYAIDRVVGWEQGTSQERRYEPFYAFSHEMAARDRDALFYHTRLVDSVVGQGTESYITFVSQSGAAALPPTETIGIEMTCTNRRLPSSLGVGDIHVATSTSPEYATFTNITRVTGAVPPPLGEGLHWRLISHLALSRLPMMSADVLRGILSLYNFQARVDRQAAAANQLRLDGIRTVHATSTDLLFRGAPVRGSDVSVDLDEESFTGEGDMVLFGSVLNELFATLSTVNAFTRLTVRGVRQGEVYRWPARLGRQTLL